MESQITASFAIPTCTQTCVVWPNGIACTHTSEKDTDIDLRQLSLGDQTMKNLRQLVREFELDQSESKRTQVVGKQSHKFTQVSNVINCDFI